MPNFCSLHIIVFYTPKIYTDILCVFCCLNAGFDVVTLFSYIQLMFDGPVVNVVGVEVLPLGHVTREGSEE